MESINPQEQIAQQLEHWAQQEKHCKQQSKAWREVSESILRGDLRKAQKQLAPLSAGAELIEWCKVEERQRPLRFTKQLREAAEAQGLECQTLGSSPPTVRLDPLEIELDFARGEAILRYARLEAGRIPLEPSKILSERDKIARSLEGESFAPEEFLAKLYAAYRRALVMAQLKFGERVELVDLLPELAFLMQGEKFRKDPTRESFRPYGKVRFAYDLARLRRSRKLEHLGSRLSLGTATLGTTRNKDRVLFLEEAGQGQYYLSLAFQGVS